MKEQEEHMPFPRTQRERLAKDLAAHEQELQALQASPQHNDPEIRADIDMHQTMLQVGRNAHLLAALDELYEHPEVIDELAAHPEQFLHARNISLPEGVRDILTRKTPAPMQVELHFQRARSFCLIWDREAGCGARMLPSGT